MKYYISFVLFFVFICSTSITTTYAQTRPANLRKQADIFRNYMGYKNAKGEILMEGEGYNIVITGYKMAPNEHNFTKIANTLSGNRKVVLKKLNGSPLENYVLDGSLPKETPPITSYDFLYAGKIDNIIDVNISKYDKADIAKVKQVVASVYYDGIYDSILIDTRTNKVDFIGHKMDFVDGCAWLKPHMVQCGKGGSITWSIYNALAEAEIAKKEELTIALASASSKKQDTVKVPVIFEGKEVDADKVIFDHDFMDVTLKNGRASNVYYIATEIRGKFVFCRIAFPIDEVRMPFLISRIMKVR